MSSSRRVRSGAVVRTGIAVALLAILGNGEVARAQQTTSESQKDHPTIQELLKRVEQLEKQVLELQAKNAAPAAPAVAPTEVANPAPPAPRAATGETQQGGPPMEMAASEPGLKIRGFTDLTFHGGDQKGTTTSFSLGSLNLFITSEVSEKFKFLSELVFEAGPDNAMGVDLERMLLMYSYNDYFNFEIGRYHTAIGYYSTAYHHSSWLQTTVGRPFLFAFEDNGGILPIHNVGVSVSGRIPSGRVGLHYVAEVGNGRTSRTPQAEAVQNVVDENNGKAVNFAVFARPEALHGFQTGFSIYHDKLAPAGLPNIGETILAAHAVYSNSTFEWLNEALVIRNAPQGSFPIFHTPAFYSQISKRFGAYRPYFRYEYINAPVNEPLFADVGLRRGPSTGLRFDASDAVALKLQYDFLQQRGRPSANLLTTQFAFTF